MEHWETRPVKTGRCETEGVEMWCWSKASDSSECTFWEFWSSDEGVGSNPTADTSFAIGTGIQRKVQPRFIIVQVAINYSDTGSIAISAHNLGFATITSLDYLAEVWSVANVMQNRQLMESCLPPIVRHFENLCLRGEMLMHATAEYFEVLLDRKRQGGMSEETKFKVISKWLDAGREECGVEKRPKAFGKTNSKNDVYRLPPQSQTEYWEY
ncbi:hypothetical protein EGR_11031 [Echinococcus granulosus]|uniref:Uncharacterized protein n=1 Tax=Echinococcus granulosus TaxID=6210 RepID=W6TZ86_ECHGR|nr:hypothetical protein EGR_11031 [Echinococcus granulosus]EUB54110.1 hypothetical protein EGR_11031 [Echinococcus granulosus]